MAFLKEIHKDLFQAIELVYNTCDLTVSQPIIEAESAEYGACSFTINDKKIKFRTAKITPTKTGQFVTLWKRKPKNGPIEPFSLDDEIDLFIISVKNDEYFGQFIFPKSVLHSKGIISDKNKGGKRAIRVYPPWDITSNKQAIKTQQWQLNYFLEISSNSYFNTQKIKSFF